MTWKKTLEEEDIAAAVESINALFAMVQHFASQANPPLKVWAEIVEQEAIGSLMTVLNSGGLSTKELAAVNIGEDVSFHAVLLRTMRMEEAFCLGDICHLGGHHGFSIPCTEEDDRLASSGSAFVYRMTMLGDDLKAHRRLVEARQRLAAQPYHATIDAWNQLTPRPDCDSEGVPAPSRAAWNFGTAARSAALSDALHGSARVALAMHR